MFCFFSLLLRTYTHTHAHIHTHTYTYTQKDRHGKESGKNTFLQKYLRIPYKPVLKIQPPWPRACGASRIDSNADALLARVETLFFSFYFIPKFTAASTYQAFDVLLWFMPNERTNTK